MPLDSELRHGQPSRMNIFSAAGLGALLLGAAGFAAGFFGPLALNPSANQGPLMGIFLAGPGGAALGAVPGLVPGQLGMPCAILVKTLCGIAAFGAIVILFFALPTLKFVGNVVEVEIMGCSSPAALKQAAFDCWDKRITAANWASARPAWKEDFEAQVASDPGGVFTVRVKRTRGIHENRKPWNAGTFSPGEIAWVMERYFLRSASCADQVGRAAMYASRGQNSTGWPAQRLSNFLNLQVLQPAAAEQTRFPQ